MATYNRVILVGNLTKDPEVRFLESGTAVASFSIAVNSKYTQNGEVKEEVSYFDVEAWKKTAELCGEYLTKGRPVLIEGRLKQERWESEGQKRSRVKVVATAVQFLGGKKEEAAQSGDEELI